MHRPFVKSLLLLVSLAMASGAASASISKSTQDVLANLRANATPEQYRDFDQAIQASPALSAQLNELSGSGQLTRLSIAAPASAHEMFRAKRDGSTWTFTPELVQQMEKTRIYDVVYPDDILPNNVVFVLGHLAFHASHAAALKASEDTMKAGWKTDAAAHQPGAPLDATANIQKWTHLHLEDEAGAFVQGWNDVLDAALHQNHDAPLTMRQCATLLMNLRYRAVFFSAMKSPDHKLVIADNGHIDANPSNLDAIANALGTMAVMDIQ